MSRPDSPAGQYHDAEHIYRVSELNGEIHFLLESAYPAIWIEGEISNFRLFQASGHWYFTLKDGSAHIAAAMFRGRNRHLRFQPEDGMNVLARAQVSLYEPRGTYQLIVSHLEPRGAGHLHLAFEQLKQRLAAEGLFDAARKRPLPLVPRRVGVVTSREGAALRDILRVLRRRHSGISVLVVPTRVQGEGAAEEIAAAIQTAGRVADLDVLIVGRGGGSLEDLWPFNQEPVARAIAASPWPVISAVGHEVDVTIADFAADVRAPTPSAAAEMVAASRSELSARVHGLGRRLAGAVQLTLSRLRAGPAGRFPLLGGRILDSLLRRMSQNCDERAGRLPRALEQLMKNRRQQCQVLTSRLSTRSLLSRVADRRERLHELSHRHARAAGHRLQEFRHRLAMVMGHLQDLSPLAVLERGYALARRAGTNELIRDAGQVTRGEQVDLRLHRGRLVLEVLNIQPDSAES
ncbi:MAG: exodeoxyribonuclease VII large subunit [Acidobacteriota bacterium]